MNRRLKRWQCDRSSGGAEADGKPRLLFLPLQLVCTGTRTCGAQSRRSKSRSRSSKNSEAFSNSTMERMLAKFELLLPNFCGSRSYFCVEVPSLLYIEAGANFALDMLSIGVEVKITPAFKGRVESDLEYWRDKGSLSIYFLHVFIFYTF